MVSPTNFSAPTISSPAQSYFPISPSDSVNILGGFRSLYIGTTGDIVIVDQNGNSCSFTSVPVGILPVQGSRVNATGTSAGGIVGLV